MQGATIKIVSPFVQKTGSLQAIPSEILFQIKEHLPTATHYCNKQEN
jgi:hypothetical protein